MNRKKTQNTATNDTYFLESTWQDEDEVLEKNIHIGMKEFDDWIDHDIISSQMIDLDMKILSKNYRHRRFIETCVFLCVSLSVVVMLVMVCVQMLGIFIALQLICAGCISFVANKFQQAVKAVKA